LVFRLSWTSIASVFHECNVKNFAQIPFILATALNWSMYLGQVSGFPSHFGTEKLFDSPKSDIDSQSRSRFAVNRFKHSISSRLALSEFSGLFQNFKFVLRSIEKF
jgi:hypothetical protein